MQKDNNTMDMTSEGVTLFIHCYIIVGVCHEPRVFFKEKN